VKNDPFPPQVRFRWAFDDLDPGCWDSAPLLALSSRVTSCKMIPTTRLLRGWNTATGLSASTETRM